MRVLIADRNARLLESISRTFAQQFSIQIATTHEQCNGLLQEGEFDLVLISEKLADGPGLQLLGQIARNSPDTLRIFVARRSRLELLKGKLGPFGLFRTLAYPIGPQDLLSALTLARSGLEVDVPVPPPPRTRNAAPRPAPAQVRRTVERISLTSADARFEINVPMLFASMAKARRSNSRPAPPRQSSRQAQGAVSAPQDSAPQPTTKAQNPAPQPAPSQAAAARPAASPRVPSPGRASQHTLVRHTAAARRARVRVDSRSSQQVRVPRTPTRTRVVLGATIAAVFLVTTLTVNLLDAGVHLTHASAPRQEVQQPDIAASSRESMPVDVALAFHPAPSVARRVEPAKPDVEPSDPKIAASTTPVADPSTFGSEAYEPIYSN